MIIYLLFKSKANKRFREFYVDFFGEITNRYRYIAWCGKFRIFLSLRFYVKSIWENWEVQKMPVLQILGL